MNKFATLALLAVFSCKGKQDQAPAPGPAGGSAAEPTAPAGGAVTLNASGATFQKAAQEVAIEAFKKANPTITINYGAGGSGKGRRDFADQVVDYACTDAPYKDTEVGTVKGGEFVYIPNVLGAITVSYNLEGVDKLQLSAG